MRHTIVRIDRNRRYTDALRIVHLSKSFPLELTVLRRGIINPHILSLLARVRHTNRLVIADRGFPFWPEIETIDLSLVDGIPTVLNVLHAIVPMCQFGGASMAQEFQRHNPPEIQASFAQALDGIPISLFEHNEFKLFVPGSIGLIRTADAAPYSNVLLVSA